jgi:hypothetical protein
LKEKKMKRAALLILVSVLLTGCSASSLQKVEEKTRLAGATNPLGAAIHLPIWAVSTVVNAASGTGLSGSGEVTVVEAIIPEGTVVEKQRQRWRPGLPSNPTREEYDALTEEEYEALMANVPAASQAKDR